MNRTLLLIPTYNEKENVRPLSEKLLTVFPEADLLFIDDGSPDGTGELLDGIAGEDSRVRVMHRREKQGLGSAYLCGIRKSIGEEYAYTVCLDADLSHDPEDLPRFLDKLQSYDLVGGSRYLKNGGIVNWPKQRLLLSKAAAVYVRLLTRMPFTDPTGGFNAYSNECLKQLPLDQVSSRGYSFQIEMKFLAWKKGFSTCEIPIVFTERREGKSKMSAGIIREALWVVWKRLRMDDL